MELVLPAGGGSLIFVNQRAFRDRSATRSARGARTDCHQSSRRDGDPDPAD